MNLNKTENNNLGFKNVMRPAKNDLADLVLLYLINNPRMFNLGTDDLAIKPYIPHKSLFQ